jgi:hypothetical protein
VAIHLFETVTEGRMTERSMTEDRKTERRMSSLSGEDLVPVVEL